ncbi:fibrillin-2-like isoform X1 [Oculina patagonica]
MALLVLSCFGKPSVFSFGATTQTFASPGRHVCVKKRMEVRHVQTVKKFLPTQFSNLISNDVKDGLCGCAQITEQSIKQCIGPQCKARWYLQSHICMSVVQVGPGSLEKSGCTKPICEKSCQHGGICIGPSTCQCVRGWTGGGL